MACQRIGDAAAVSVCARTRIASVSSPFSNTHALNGDIDGPVWRRKVWMWSAMNGSDDRMMPPRQRPCPSMCLVAEYTTTSAPNCSGLCQIGVANTLSTISRAPAACAISAMAPMSSTSSVGIGRAFQKAAFGVRPHRLLPLLEIEAVDQRRRDAVARQQIFHHIAARAEHRLRRDHVIAGLQRRQDRGRHRGHAGGGGARGACAFELDHAALEHRDVRIGKARIQKAGFVALEPRLALFGAVVDKALGQEQRFGRFAELRAQRAGMNQPGFGTVARPCGRRQTCDLRRDHFLRKWAQKNRPGKNSTDRDHTVPGLFSDLFNVAASRPAQITTG